MWFAATAVKSGTLPKSRTPDTASLPRVQHFKKEGNSMRENLKKARKEAGMTQQQIAERLGISVVYYQKIEQNDQVKGILKSFFEKGKLTAAICAGPTVLGHMGLLKGKKYTCFTSMNEDFGGTYVDQYVVTDGNLITGRSAAASIDMAFAIIEYVLGQEECEKVKQSVYY